MTQSEYQTLVKKAFSFRSSSAAEQNKILQAQGADMDYYAQIYQEENDLFEKAATKFIDDSNAVVLDFKVSVKHESANKLKKKEEKTRSMEENKLDNLLKNI